MSMRPAKVQFNGGELSPWLEGRVDIAKYDKTAKLCRNFIPIAEGSLKRRGGTKFVAFTMEDEDVVFKIITEPYDAKVIINGMCCNEISVARGDEVSYEVTADGYVSARGNMVVSENCTLEIKLVSEVDTCVLTIVSVPSDATVKIAGVERSVYTGAKNSEVAYSVYKDGYKINIGTVILDEDKTLNIELEYNNGNIVYSDWGDPLKFVACTAVGRFDKQYKCFMLRFSNGYLPVIFDANLEAPLDDYVLDETMFYSTIRDEYNAVYYEDEKYHIGTVVSEDEAIRYYDLDGEFVAGFSYAEGMYFGWQVDEYGQYASVYKSYTGEVVDNVINVYRNGNLVWQLKGR